MAVQIYPVLWPNDEQYPAFREICGDQIPPTLEAYRFAALEYVESLGYGGLFKEIPFDLNDLRRLIPDTEGGLNRQRLLRLAFMIWEEERERVHGRPYR